MRYLSSHFVYEAAVVWGERVFNRAALLQLKQQVLRHKARLLVMLVP